MKRSDVSVLVVARQGRARDCLCALLEAAPQIATIRRAGDVESALLLVADIEPNIVLLDTNLADDQAYPALRQIKAARPQPCCIVLADSVRQQQMAGSAGADAALLKGFRTAELCELIDRLLSG